MGLKPRRAPGSPGMTLIEIMIVLTIIGIGTGIALWKIDIARYQMNGDMQAVGTALIASQREAIAKQHNLIVTFDAGNNALHILFDANNNDAQDSGERVRTVSLGDRVRYGRSGAPARPFGSSDIDFTTLVNGLPAIVFYRNGSASEAGGLYLTSTRAQTDNAYVKDVRAIQVSRATGRAEWWHYDGTHWTRGF